MACPLFKLKKKKETHDINEALNQMHQYIAENQYSDIFSTLQLLIAITPNNVKYMANTTADRFNKDFAFNWQRQSDNKPVYHWKAFADSMLSIPMAHQMATNYMILDGTPNKQTLKVMRPYQVYATRCVMDKLKRADFDQALNKLGYIWHTTGSGKTITSFKTAWLASRSPKVDKVVFLVDRIALTNQTTENYRAYDPDATEDSLGSVLDTNNTTDLNRKLHSKGSQIIITSVQKLDTLVKRTSFKAPEKNIVFIVDEAHRSTGSDNFAAIQKNLNILRGLVTPARQCLMTLPKAYELKIFSVNSCTPIPFEKQLLIVMCWVLKWILKPRLAKKYERSASTEILSP